MSAAGTRTAARLGGFGLALALAFGAAYGVGQAVEPVVEEPAPTAPKAGPDDGTPAHGHQAEAEGETDGGGHGGGHGEGVDVPAGLMVSTDGFTLDVLERTSRELSFRILDDQNNPVTRFQPSHDKLMHLIVARRDLSGFRHVHPTMAPDGTWRVPLSLDEPGDYRVFADFLPTGRAEGVTLGADVAVPGEFRPRPLPEPTTTATVDGYRVTLEGHLDAGETSELTLTIDRDGVPVTDLQPYLAAYGHLVALRQGDLAYLHVHPDGEPGDGRTRPGPSITFFAEVPSAGTYRLYLDFKHGDVVRTAELTAVATPH